MNRLLPKRKQSDSESSLIPLINIVFLLLIFFMVAGQISQLTDDEIAVPISISEQSISKVDTLITFNTKQELTLNNHRVSLSELNKTLENNQQKLTIKADKTLTAKELEPLLTLLREKGFANFILMSKQADSTDMDA